MIYTNFGLPVTILKGNIKKNEVTILLKDGTILERQLSELKSDGGFNEIEKEVNRANKGNA